MRAEAIIDLDAIKFNVQHLKKKAGTDVLAVVKADAYGHGLIPVAKAALSAGASYLGVALLEEAITLRENGITAPILAWLVQPGSDFESAITLDIDLAAASIKALLNRCSLQESGQTCTSTSRSRYWDDSRWIPFRMEPTRCTPCC